MFNVELDVHVIFIPPMSESGPGIIMTRAFALPFAPYAGLAVYGNQWECCDEPDGIRLKQVVWDVDRQVFLATGESIHDGFPIATIPGELSDWVQRGWRLGSYLEHYSPAESSAPPGPLAQAAYDLHDTVSSGDYEILHTLPPKRRPEAFNTFWKALIRQMGADFANADVAYAMDKTGCYLGRGRTQPAELRGRDAWDDYHAEFQKLSIDDRIKWMQKVSKYPHLSSVVLQPAASPESVKI